MMTRLTLLFAVLAVSLHAQTEAPSIESAMTALGFPADAKARILAGEILSKDLAEGSDKELAAVLAFRVRAPLAKLLAAARAGKTLEIERDMLGLGNAETTLDKLGYTADEADDARTALNSAPGSKLNFSAAEIERWRALKAKLKNADPGSDPQALAAINAEYRAILADRLAAYKKSGLAGIAPYTRGKSEASPGGELKLASQESLLAKAFPEFHKAVIGFPSANQEKVENEYLWFKQRVENRPIFILAHRMYRPGADHAVAMERQIYVGASYNSQQAITGGRVEGDALIVLYGNRCFTDQVAGFGSGMKHGIGRKQMVSTLEAHFENVRKLLEK